MRLGKSIQREISLNSKLRNIMLSIMIPLVFLIILMFIILGLYIERYAEITHNVNVSSRFSLNFRDSMDLKMYHYSVHSKEQTELPIEDVENAIHLAKSLKSTTYRKESRRSIQNILDYCSNLENKMYMLANTQDYDSRNLQLDNNIYVLTNLIQEKMIDYMYYEVGYMSELEAEMIDDLKLVMIIAVILVIGSIILLLYLALQFTNGITRPITALCENVNRVGTGDFSIPQVESRDYEIEQLNTGIQKMATRISLLLENVKKEEELQHMTQIQLLQAQINPHFLYNTLDTIVWLVESEQYDESIDVLTNLSLFFRSTLSKGKDVIFLEEEILHTHSYLEIQQVRYRDILDFEISIPDELRKVKVPKLTLQPLAENALYHGVKEKRGKSKIIISCKKLGEDILLTVSDNGIGISPEHLKEIQSSLKEGGRIGFGLAAVHERVKLYCGQKYGVRITSEFEKGTTVQVFISNNIQQESGYPIEPKYS